MCFRLLQLLSINILLREFVESEMIQWYNFFV